MTAKDCGRHHLDERKKLYRLAAVAVLAFVLLILFIIFLVWLILRPTKPRFILLDPTIYAFNVSGPTFLTSDFQVTLSSRNPNARIGIYYDKLDVYAAYRSQQITLPTILPADYQGHKDVNVWSPFLYGNAVPIAPYLADVLAQDQMAGTLLINVRINGRVRWKVGTFISGRYHLYVNCPAYISFGGKNNGVPVGPAVKFQLVQSCHVVV